VLLPGDRSPLVPVGVVVVGASLLVLAGRPDARRPLGALLSRRGRGGGSHPGRVVLEGLVVVVATVAVVGLRQRGVLPDGDVDPLVVAAPVLATVAAALLVARLLPLPLALLDLVVRRRAGLGASVGVARAARDPRVRAAVPLVVVGIAVVGFGLAIDGTVGAGQSDAADVAVGADVRIAAQALASLDQDWVPPDPDAVVVELALVDGDLVTSTGSDELRVVAVDVSALGALATDLPPLATGVGPAPLVVSNVVRLAGSPGVGTTLNVLVGLTRVPATIVELRPRALGLDLTDGQFVLIDREAVVRATGEVPATTTRLVVTDRPELVAASARAADPSADVVQRADVAADLAAAPLASGVRIGFRTAAGAAGAATAVALLLQLAAGGRVRRREAAVLGAVGTPPAEVRRAALAEVLPVVLGAALAGAGLARAATVLLADRLDLSSFTGQTAGTAAIMAPSAPALVGLVVAAGLVAATGVVATLGRIDMTGVLREEG
jgi:putative ABC transport system permease protein